MKTNPDKDAGIAGALRVLVVDPSTEGDRLAAQCADHGLTVIRARTASSALDQILGALPGVAVVEVDLPDATGLDLAQILTGEVHVPLFLTSATRSPESDAILQGGMAFATGFLQKPYQIPEALARLAKAAGRDLQQSRSAAAAVVDEKGNRWGKEDVVDGEMVLLVEEVVASEPTVAEPAEILTARSAREQLLLDRAAASRASDGSASGTVAPSVLEIWEHKVAAYRPPPPAPVLVEALPPSGRLAQLSVVQLFDNFFQARRSGELALVREEAKRLILFSHGHPAFARSNLAKERLGYHLRALRLVTEDDLQAALTEAGGSDLRLGEVLLRQGKLDETQRRKALARVVRTIVLSSFAWTDGLFQVGLVDRARAEPLRVPMKTGNAILRGLALTSSLETLRSAVPLDARFAPVPDPVYPLEQLTLTDVEARVLSATDGTKTVADLGSLYDVEERTLLGLMYGLARLNVIELVGHGQATPREINFF
ncbi:MAG: DUF4388 domain-containing protein [Deltaproteobacteria bacterium]|nr:DUF4388 domain-containing protein [Deltaproteobacteria bacterium]